MQTVVDKNTKRVHEVEHCDDEGYENISTEFSCVILVPVSGDVFTLCRAQLRRGRIIKQLDITEEWTSVHNLEQLYCCNYVLGPRFENFLRVDEKPTIVQSTEHENENKTRLNYTTEIKSGHAILSTDIKYAFCAGEIRVRFISSENPLLVRIVSINLQSSCFGFPPTKLLESWHDRFKMDAYLLYRGNDWEDRGRSKQLHETINNAPFL
jgi:hypothetical protein